MAFFNLKIKLAAPKKPKSQSFKRASKITTGTIREDEEGNFKVEVVVKDKLGLKNTLLLPLTPKSFEVKDKTTVFTKAKNERGHRVRIIRDAWHAKIHPGTTYYPFDDKSLLNFRLNCLFFYHSHRIHPIFFHQDLQTSQDYSYNTHMDLYYNTYDLADQSYPI